MDTEVEDKKETKRQKQVDLLETDMIMQASPHLSMLEADRQTDCIHDSYMHKTDSRCNAA